MYSIRMSIRLTILIFFSTTLFWISCTKENPPNYPIDSPPVDNPPDSTAFDDGGDLSIRFIQRLPEIDYVQGSANPAVEGWPEVGQEVLWRSHIKNWANNERSNVGYAWFFDGVEVDSGRFDIPANEEITVDYPWLWTFNRHVITLQIDPQNEVDEEAEDNNQLSIFTDAITVGFAVEQLYYDRYRYLWDDWMQKRIGQWNEMLENAIFPETPNGVLDRIRIDNIASVPNDAIWPDILESLDDRTIDMFWHFRHDWVDNYEIFVSNPYSKIHAESTLHELGHARYLVDTYGFDVKLLQGKDVIDIRENDASIVGSPYLPYVGPNSSVYQTPFKGLMYYIDPNYQYRMDRYGAAAMNLIAGHRNVGTGNLGGIFMNDLPEENRLCVKDLSGEVIAGADIRIYQSVPRTGLYAKYFDDEPDLQFTTDENGQVLVGRNPFNTDGPIIHSWVTGSNVVAIVRVEVEGKIGYGFLEVGWFNLAYWRGETELADHEIKVQMISD